MVCAALFVAFTTVGASAYVFQARASLLNGAGPTSVQFGDVPPGAVGNWVAPMPPYLGFALIRSDGAKITKLFAVPEPAEYVAILWGTPDLSEITARLTFWCQALGNDANIGRNVTGEVWGIYDSEDHELWSGVVTSTGSSTSPLATLELPIVKTSDPVVGSAPAYHFRPALGRLVSIDDGGETTTSSTSLSASWEPVSTLPDIEEYLYAIGTSFESLLVDWKSAGTATGATEAGLGLELGQTYYWFIKARHSGDVWTPLHRSDGIKVVRPAAPAVEDGETYVQRDTAASWTAPDPFGIVEYRYAIGASLDNLVVDWKSVGTQAGAAETDLPMVPGVTYRWFVQALNGGELWSEIGQSDGVTAVSVVTIPEAKSHYVGQPVLVNRCTVTSATSDFPGLWVQSPDRASGIRVDAPLPAARGDRIDVAGIVRWTDGVPSLANPEIKGQQSGTAPAAPGATNLDLAPDLTETLTYAGFNPVGLLVSTWGRVTRVDTTARVFYVNDGSHLADGMGPSYDPFIGLRVAYKSGMVPPAPGKFVRVTGIRTVQKVTLAFDAFVNGEYRFAGETLYLPVLMVRDPGDIIVIIRT